MFGIQNENIVKIRREIHEYPELDFEMEKTLAVVKRELDKIGLAYTEDYGKGSLVAYINPEKDNFTIALRADMDALRIHELTDVPFRSKVDGKMHACGHDAHTAILIETARVLKSMENDINCRVKLLFQPSEEGMKSGAMMMVENGVLDDVDIIAGLHISNNMDSGLLGLCPGERSASSRHFTIEIEGKQAHAAAPHKGIDALAIAVRLYEAIQLIVTREVSPLERYLCQVGKLEAGTSQNIVAGSAKMVGTIRAYKVEISDYIWGRIEQIAQSLAAETGAKIKTHGPLKSLCVYNNPYLSEVLKASMAKVIGAENVKDVKPTMGSEDFSRFSEKVPAVFFTIGTRDEATGCTTPAHNERFKMDDAKLENGAATFVQFVLDNQNGVDMQKVKDSEDR